MEPSSSSSSFSSLARDGGGKAEEGKSQSNNKKKPIVALVIGMAGSGKTTFMQRLQADITRDRVPGYLVPTANKTHSELSGHVWEMT